MADLGLVNSQEGSPKPHGLVTGAPGMDFFASLAMRCPCYSGQVLGRTVPQRKSTGGFLWTGMSSVVLGCHLAVMGFPRISLVDHRGTCHGGMQFADKEDKLIFPSKEGPMESWIWCDLASTVHPMLVDSSIQVLKVFKVIGLPNAQPVVSNVLSLGMCLDQ
ncbi:hypothetical protein P7K49_012851 [Saguinus oedipus]|uniref:Uncharacterized protein n=1 Tax=Saguinus oedipus TaxID=9490 RepID=A0ABQ9VEI8_SAGOE|nr:hypothetical protein P7K49_012851 [Saguinus oedipus]